MDEFSLLASLLLLEAKNSTSPFRHYLCSLPRHVPLPFYWTNGKIHPLSMLPPPSLPMALDFHSAVMLTVARFWAYVETVQASRHSKDSRFLTSILSAGHVLINSYLAASQHLFDLHRGAHPSFFMAFCLICLAL